MSLPIYQKVYRQILTDIELGHYVPGDALPAEIGLATSFNTSIGTIRKAVEILVLEGYLEKKQGSGTFVRRKRYERSLLHCFKYLAINSQEFPSSFILEKNKIIPSPKVAQALCLEAGEYVIEIKRLRMFGDNIRIYEEVYLPCAIFPDLDVIPIREIGPLFYPFYAERYDVHISRLQETLSIIKEHEDASKILLIQQAEPIIAIERVAYSYDNHPLEWRCSYGLAKEFRYQIDVV